MRPLVELADDPAGGSLEQKRQESVNERRTRGGQQAPGKPAGKGHVAQIGLVDGSRMVSEELCDACAHGRSPNDCRSRYLAIGKWFIGPNLSLKVAHLWDIHPKMADE